MNNLPQMKDDIVNLTIRLEDMKKQYMFEYEKTHNSWESTIEEIKIDALSLPEWEKKLLEKRC